MNVTVNYLYKRFITLLKKSNVHTRDSTLQSGQRAPHIRELIQAPALQLGLRLPLPPSFDRLLRPEPHFEVALRELV